MKVVTRADKKRNVSRARFTSFNEVTSLEQAAQDNTVLWGVRLATTTVHKGNVSSILAAV